VVPPDVLAAELTDRPVHDRPGDTEPFLQPDRVPLGGEPAQELGLEPRQPLEVPWLQGHDEVGRQAPRPAHEHVVEEVLHLAGHPRPVDPRDRPGPRDEVALGITVGVRLHVLVVVAALPGVVGVGHRVVRPERDVDSGELAEVGELGEFVRGEPQPRDPLVERLPRLPLVERERQQRLRGDHRLGRLGLVLQVGRAVRAPVGGDPVFEQHDCPAAGAPDLLRPAGDRDVRAGVVLQVRLEVVLLDLPAVVRDLLDEPAIGALERAAGRVEVELGAALFAGELAARGRGLRDDGRVFAAVGSVRRLSGHRSMAAME
jgi:hypothetical protein